MASTLWLLKDVCVNCFCASLLCTQIHIPRHASMCVLSKKMNNDRADGIATALPGFNNLVHLVTLFFSWWSFSLHLAKKWKKKSIDWIEVWNFLQNTPSNPILLVLCSYVWWFQMPLEGFTFVKMLVTFGIIYTTDLLLQSMTEITCLQWLTFKVFNKKPLQTMLNYVHQFFKISSFHTLCLWNEVSDPQFIWIWHKQLIIWLQ